MTQTLDLTSLPHDLPDAMKSSVSLLPTDKPMVLFARHSIRELEGESVFSGYQLPLTEQGRQLAVNWGAWLQDNGLQLTKSVSSPIQRCVDTVELMQQGAGISSNITTDQLLVEPGSYITDVSKVGKKFFEMGAIGFLNAFLRQELEGTKTPVQGVMDILRLLYDSQPTQAGELSIVCSHDTILVVFMAVLLEQPEITQADWPAMMEGVFLWFDESDKAFESSNLNLVWQGQLIQHDVNELLARM